MAMSVAAFLHAFRALAFPLLLLPALWLCGRLRGETLRARRWREQAAWVGLWRVFHKMDIIACLPDRKEPGFYNI